MSKLPRTLIRCDHGEPSSIVVELCFECWLQLKGRVFQYALNEAAKHLQPNVSRPIIKRTP